MANGRLKRIQPELWKEIEKDLKEHNNLIQSKIAQIRLANLIREVKGTYNVPKFEVDFNIKKWHFKKGKGPF